MNDAAVCDYCGLPVSVKSNDGAVHAESPLFCCYGCSFAARITRQSGERGQAVWMLTRLGLAGFLTMCVMMCSIYLYGREVYEGDGSNATSDTIAQVLRYASLLLSTPVLFLLGAPVLQAARAQWQVRSITTDTLVVFGVVAAFLYSYVVTLRGFGSTYYETACMILLFMTLGRWFEAVGKLHAFERVMALEKLLPATVRVLRVGTEMTIQSNDIQIGDVVHVFAGDRLAVDGVVERGIANVDEQIVTGESRSIVKQPGGVVSAGTLALDGDLFVRATSVGKETTLGRLITLLESARATKGRYERIADRVAGYFLPGTILLAAIAAVLGLFRAGAHDAIMSSLAVLLIACPCGLGIATPMAVWMALGRAAAHGAMFRSGETLEILARVRTVYFDKTGTLTTGAPRVAGTTLNTGITLSEAVSAAAGLAASSRHSVSMGLVRFANDNGIHAMPASCVTTIAGRGLESFGPLGKVMLGNEAMMADASMDFSESMRAALDEAHSSGQSVVCLGLNNRVQAVFTLDEELRAGVRDALNCLNELGCRVVVLTGDHAARGRAISRELSVETHAALLPADKFARVAGTSRQDGLVAMVGDGLNDAPAMAAADVGIAMGCGADVTRESAAICLLGNDPRALPDLIALARRTVRTIRVNLFWVFLYNGIGLALAVAGKLNPVVAAVAMVASSLFVIGNSLRLCGPRLAVRATDLSTNGRSKLAAYSSDFHAGAPA
ncbi:MAG: cation-translocating P-type ATPase [Planctomycetes bacterium]|nr:cation-translocating P-type ATPase [Planctomycetota bacterium]